MPPSWAVAMTWPATRVVVSPRRTVTYVIPGVSDMVVSAAIDYHVIHPRSWSDHLPAPLVQHLSPLPHVSAGRRRQGRCVARQADENSSRKTRPHRLQRPSRPMLLSVIW
jgi:hypothetical protein